jgi:catechol 2,3-dioxygenase-like lactoylglutathione lyase family enzyme
LISHIYLGVADFERSFAFYSPLMAELGLQCKFSDPVKAWAGWVAPDAPRPLFLIGKPFDGAAAAPGNGQMVALLAPTRAAVERVHAIALAQGGQCEGAPGLRPQYHPDYYGAYFRDLDGNKICICCHQAA